MATTIHPISNPGLTLGILDDEAVRRIHTTTLEVIESVGVRFPSEQEIVGNGQIGRKIKVLVNDGNAVMSCLCWRIAMNGIAVHENSPTIPGKDPGQDLDQR